MYEDKQVFKKLSLKKKKLGVVHAHSMKCLIMNFELYRVAYIKMPLECPENSEIYRYYR